MHKNIFYLVIVIGIGFLAYSLGSQVYDSLGVSKRLDKEVEDLLALQEKNNQLKSQLAETETTVFIEQQARNRLNLTLPEEVVVIVPEEEINRVLGINNAPAEIKIPNWQGWLKLFWK